MDKYVFVIAILGIVFGTGLIKYVIKLKHEKATEEPSGLAEKVEALTERIEVLERIATDKSQRLKDEIDGL